MSFCSKCGGRGWIFDPHNRRSVPCTECEMRQRMRRASKPKDGGPLLRPEIEPERGEPYHGFAPFEKISETSTRAAEAIEPHRGTLQARVLGVIDASGERGMTDAEVEASTGLSHQTTSARRRELHLMGLIGTESRRRNPSGRAAQVFKVAALCINEEATVAPMETRRCRHCGRTT
jgi:hypothetical protein